MGLDSLFRSRTKELATNWSTLPAGRSLFRNWQDDFMPVATFCSRARQASQAKQCRSVSLGNAFEIDPAHAVEASCREGFPGRSISVFQKRVGGFHRSDSRICLEGLLWCMRSPLPVNDVSLCLEFPSQFVSRLPLKWLESSTGFPCFETDPIHAILEGGRPKWASVSPLLCL